MSKKFNGHRCERRNLTDLVLGTGPTGKKRSKPKAKKRPKNFAQEPAVNKMTHGGSSHGGALTPLAMAPSSTAVVVPGMPQPVLDQSMVPDVTVRMRSPEEEAIYRDQVRRYLNASRSATEQRYGGVPKAELGLATQGIPGLGNIFNTLDRYANPPAVPGDMPDNAASAFNDYYMNADPSTRIGIHEYAQARPDQMPYVRLKNDGERIMWSSSAISPEMHDELYDARTRDEAYAQYGNQFQQGMAPTQRDLSYEPEYQMNMGSQEPGDPSDPNFTGANTRTSFDPSGLLKFAGKLGQKNAMKGLSASQVPGAMAEFNKKMGKLNLAGTAMGSLGSFLNQQAQGEAGPMDQFRYNAPDGTMATAGDILSGAGRFAQFGPAGMIGGAVYGAIAGKKRRENAAEAWQEGFDERNDAMASANAAAAYDSSDRAYAGYADEGNFYMTMGGSPDYETEKNEVILASPGDKPIAMTGNSYKKLSTNLYKGRGPSHEHGGIPTKGATEPFVDSGGNYQDSPYVFSDAYKIDPTEFLSMLS